MKVRLNKREQEGILMNVCKKCGFSIPEGVLFCKKCGTPVQSIETDEMDAGLTIEELTKYSLDMRELSDHMIATYVKAVKKMELELDKVKIEAESTISKLERKIREYEGEIRRYKAYVSDLEEKVSEAEAYTNQLLGEKTVLEKENKKLRLEHLDREQERKEPTFCSNCGELLDEGTLFCGNCGTEQA